MPRVDEPDWPAEQPRATEKEAELSSKPRKVPLGRQACRKAAEVLVEGWGGREEDIEKITDILFRWCLASSKEPPEEYPGGIVPFGTVERRRRDKQKDDDDAALEERRRADIKRWHEDRMWSE